jgi:Flp pilus assembly protein TadD
LLAAACSGDKSAKTETEAGTMTRGVNLMYQGNDPSGAEAVFRQLLAKNPTHYGATYQLAAVLDRMGQPAQARPLWVKVLGMATTYKDDKTLQAARDRLR